MDGGATPGWAAGETPAPGGATPALKQRSRWDETPAGAPAGLSATPGPGATPAMGATPAWGATPGYGVTPVGGLGMETPDPSQLPKASNALPAAQLLPSPSCCHMLSAQHAYMLDAQHARSSICAHSSPAAAQCSVCKHPVESVATSEHEAMTAPQVPISAEQYQMARWEREIEERNRPLTDAELDAIIPAQARPLTPKARL